MIVRSELFRNEPRSTPYDATVAGDYLPIAEHGVVGDLHSVALVGTDGTIDWYCPGRFDAPSVFASILDAERGGHFRIAPADESWTTKQLYVPDTNVLITRFLTAHGIGEVLDFLPVDDWHGSHHQQLVRRVLCVRGTMRFRVEVEPRFDYARVEPEVHVVDGGAVFGSPQLTLALSTSVPLERTDSGVRGELALQANESVSFFLEEGEEAVPRTEDESRELFADTIDYWRRWVAHSTYRGRWREMVMRSALTHKLLTYWPTGALDAAPTTSLPEILGGGRNWDYRYTWIRDASFTLFALLRLGFIEEAAEFGKWLTDRFREGGGGAGPCGPLQVLYGIDGRRELPEETLDHLSGYRGSAPVRIGNGAADQLQLDIYGELIDSLYLFNKHGRPLSHDAWKDLSQIVEWVAGNWDQPDEGIWEVRGGRHDFTYSRLMCWVAVERAIRVARKRGLPADIPAWARTRDAIYHQIMERGWNAERQAFVQHFGSDVLDASVLLMPLVKFISPTDPRWLSTLDAISQELVSDTLVYRYNVRASPDGLEGEEGSFSICSFWYVEALARAGRVDHARLALEKMFTYANHLGLYSEEIGPTGELLGNFPQAFTHLALISAATNLDRQLG
jgi:GH15 family glucan-1,4-alpha-glucosidase